MSNQNVLWRFAVLTLFLTLVPVLPLSAAVRDVSAPREVNRAISDLDQQLRRVIDPVVAQRIAGRVRGETRRGALWNETMFDALGVAASELALLEQQGLLSDETRHQIGAFTVVSVVQTLVDSHPELEPIVASSISTRDSSPIEEICKCDKRGSGACGCQITSTGIGKCQYRVRCSTIGGAFCSAINLQMCAAQTVIDIVSPIR